MARGKRIYKIVFHNQGKIYEMHAKRVGPSSLLGFIEVEELLFGSGTVLVDPSEERLKAEFADVKRTYIPMQAVIRVDEVEKEGVNKIVAASDRGDANITPFPSPIFTTKRDKP
jgi:hypothetical protein